MHSVPLGNLLIGALVLIAVIGLVTGKIYAGGVIYRDRSKVLFYSTIATYLFLAVMTYLFIRAMP